MNKIICKYIFIVLVILFGSSCKDYLDIVPNDVETLDHAFLDRINAEKFLFSLYNMIPLEGNSGKSPGLTSGDEIWFYPKEGTSIAKRLGNGASCWDIAKGEQNSGNPKINHWQGENGVSNLFIGIRDCNIFLENIHKPEDMEEWERSRWIAEAKFIKAYLHFALLRLYGPIPIIDENLPTGSGPDVVRVYRDPVDDVVDYIVKTIDEAAPDLPQFIESPITETGRLTRAAALAIKARVLVWGASPLFNGNVDYKGFADSRDVYLFSQEEDNAKWKMAADACFEAIEEAHAAGHKLYYLDDVSATFISDTTRKEFDIRQSVCEPWNVELIWGETPAPSMIGTFTLPRFEEKFRGHTHAECFWSPTLRIAEQFYTKNGVPIDEDLNWDYANRYELTTTATEPGHKYYIEAGYETAKLNFHREPRFYASLGFDGGKWYGNGTINKENVIKAKLEQYAGKLGSYSYSFTGYFTKKLLHYKSMLNSNGSSSGERFPFPVIRLADLYLLYAEALNESKAAPDENVYEYIDMVRQRAGLKGVVESWSLYSTDPNKPKGKEGMRDIIRNERLNELCLEGRRLYEYAHQRMEYQ